MILAEIAMRFPGIPWWWPMMADAQQMSGEWVLELVAKIFAGLAAIVTAFVGAKIHGDRRAKQERERISRDVNLKTPVPTITVREEDDFVTTTELNRHLGALEKKIEEIKAALDGERSVARVANGNIHKRIDDMSESLGNRLSKTEGVLEGIAATTSRLLDLALNRKPGTRS